MKRKIVLIVFSLVCVTMFAGCKKSTPVQEEKEKTPATTQTLIMFEGVEPEDEVILKDLLHVDGVLIRGEEYIVAINGQVCNIGENLKLTANHRTYNLQILSISNDSVLVRAIEK